MLTDWRVFQAVADFNPAAAAKLIENEVDARYALAGPIPGPPGVLPAPVAARMLPHLVERFPGLAGGAFLENERAKDLLRCATGQLESPGYSAMSVGEARRVFDCFEPQRIRALREIGPVTEQEQKRLNDMLSEACGNELPQDLRPLLAAGARLQPEWTLDGTAAHRAVAHGRNWVMPALVEGGMPWAEVMRVDAHQFTPMALAAAWGNVNAIQAVLRAGISGREVMWPNVGGETPAHLAGRRGSGDWIRTLSAAGIGPDDLRTPGIHGRSPVHSALESGDRRGVIAALCAAGVSREALMMPDDFGRSPLHSVPQFHRASAIQALWDAGVSDQALRAAGARQYEVVAARRQAAYAGGGAFFGCAVS